MVTRYEDARRLVIERVPEPRPVRVPVLESLDLIVAEDIIAKEPLPRRNYAGISGYAVYSASTKGATREFPVEAKMVARLCAGENYRRTLGNQEAVRVVSGSILPKGADTVVMTEDADRIGKSLKIYRVADPGENVRRRGEDVGEGELVLKKGRRVRSQEIGLLTSMGISHLSVYSRPQVAILTTGAEMRSIGSSISDSQIWNGLTPMLATMVRETGGVPVDIGQSKEGGLALRFKIYEGLKYPIFILAGGIFVRNYDLIKELLDKMHVKEVFWRVNMRPGRPVYFGKGAKSLVFGLPDTLGAAFVGFEELVRPAILRQLGRERLERREITAVAGTDLKNRSRRTFFIRSYLRRNGKSVTVFPSGNQHSHIIKTLSRANAIVEMEANSDIIRRGERVKVKVLE
ncbi:MAG: molybdopterin molybdotransferase MoeA [Candidatus Omnitrophica bacterium]|nr:molybdopterin molybdotransferase MoeA [Candidatus Omnitrophota bacterium]